MDEKEFNEKRGEIAWIFNTWEFFGGWCEPHPGLRSHFSYPHNREEKAKTVTILRALADDIESWPVLGSEKP